MDDLQRSKHTSNGKELRVSFGFKLEERDREECFGRGALEVLLGEGVGARAG